MPTEERIQLFSPGSLGTCWFGKYHYLEPWAGCGHACPYCYARTRTAVDNTLADLDTTFPEPELLLPREQLLEQIEREANSGEIRVVKLCRYTDILTPRAVEDGLSHAILRVLAESKVRRIILTTKGVPDEACHRLMVEHREKFSYNAAARPSAVVEGSPLAGFDVGLRPLEERLEAAAALNRAGVQTTIHLDPFVAGFDDQDEALLPFLALLQKHGLNRVMFSYLLFSGRIVDTMGEAVPADALEEIMASYDFSGARKVLPGQEDTVSHSLQDSALRESVEKVATALEEQGFEFVLCSLKSVRGLDAKKYQRSMICNGSFYA